ncbi:phage minor head protein [Kocuria salina]|uniref:phage minor head protein n=1 Tax=Kocuria salina TaxID=1929416 RepID=UPI001594847D
MAVNDDALAHVRDASALTKRIQDEYVRDIVAAWVGAWNDLRPQFEDALSDVMLGAEDGYVTHAQMSKATRLAKALKAAHTQLTFLSEENERLIVRDLDDAISAVVDANAAAIASQLPAGQAGLVVTWDRMSDDALAAIVTRTTQQVQSARWHLADDAVAAMKKNLIRGIAVGDNPRKVRGKMVKDTETAFNGGLSRTLNLARTEMMDAHRFASQASDEANKDIVKGWTWITELSSRTCIACAVMHGTEHPMTEMGPKGHQSCRCTRAPITKSWAELGIPGIEDDKPTLQDPEAWFNNLTADSQLDVMGKSQKRLDAYLNGDVTWSELASTKKTPAWRDSIVPIPVRDLPTPSKARRVAA